MTAEIDVDRREEFERTWASPRGIRGFFTAVQHKNVGMRYMITAFAFFLVGGLQAMLMRVQLAQPESEFLGPQAYNELFTMHGTTMMFLFAVPFLEGLASYLLPLMIGTRDLAFPRYNSFNYWCYLFGGIILYSSYLFAMVPDAGWFAYVPLSGPEFADRAMDFWLFGLTLAEIAAVGAAIEIVITILRSRAPGMSLNRMPIFAWTMLAVGFLIIVAFIPLIVASLLLELDRAIGTAFFVTEAGGDPLLWQHLFWIFGHPEVYVMFLPGAAIVSHVIPVHSGRPLAAYPLVVVAIAAVAVMSLGLWVHHMYTVGLPAITLSFFTAASMSITLASGVQVFAWITTLWLGRPRFTVPMLYSLGFIVTFVAGGITGVMVASVPFDQQAHDSYFVVAHFHYVLIGGMLFPIFAALYHWWPKFTGRMYSGPAAHVGFWLIFVGFHTTFFPMHLTGLWGMPRRVYTYGSDLGLATSNLLSTIGAFILAAGVLVLIVNLTHAFVRGEPAGEDPWRGDTLEWLAASPPSNANWERIPTVTSRSPGWHRAADPEYDEPIREAFDHQPSSFRAAPTTSVVSAEPDGAALLPGPSIWPIVPPLGLAVIASSLLGQWYWLSFAGIAVLLVGLGGWAWQNEREYSEHERTPLAGRYPFEAAGAGSFGWWGALSAAIALIVGVATLGFSALYLQVGAAVWPLGPTIGRPFEFAAVLTLAVVAIVICRWGASRADREQWYESRPAVRRAHLIAGAGSLACGLAIMVVVIVIWTGSDIDPAAHAYESAAWVLLAAQVLVTAMAIGSSVVSLLGRLMHKRDSRPALLLQYQSLMWGCVVVTWIIVWIVLEWLPGWVV